MWIFPSSLPPILHSLPPPDATCLEAHSMTEMSWLFGAMFDWSAYFVIIKKSLYLHFEEWPIVSGLNLLLTPLIPALGISCLRFENSGDTYLWSKHYRGRGKNIRWVETESSPFSLRIHRDKIFPHSFSGYIERGLPLFGLRIL